MDKKVKTKPKYNLLQNSAYMISLSWKMRKSVMFLTLAASIMAVGLNLIGLYVTPTILGAIESGVPTGKLLVIILSFVGGLMLMNALNAYLHSNTSFGRIDIRCRITSIIHEKFMMMSYPHTENQDIQKSLNKATGAVSNNGSATESIWSCLSGVLTNLIGFVVYILLFMSVDPIMILVILATSIPGFFINKYIYGWAYRHREEEAEYSRRLDYVGNKSFDYTLAKDVRIFGMRGWLKDVFDSAFRSFRAFILRREKVYIWANIIDTVLTFLRNGFAYFYLINLILNNGLSASEFLLLFSAVGGFTSWVGGILSGFSDLHTKSLDISNLREFIEYPELFKFEDGEPLSPDSTKAYEIELRNVSFRYPEADSNTLDNINLKLKAGEKLAVVGLNGAGKTTLVKLICGFYDPTEGEVLLNGINIKRYNRRDYYKHFSAVFQDFSLLAADATYNIAQSGTNVDMKKVESCADKAGLLTKINSMPNKFKTNLGRDVYEDGIELSGGETQRLMLARALYKDAPVIILDEPTAALDPIAESELYNKYNDLTGGRSSVYISHRLASTRFCDRIILIDKNIIAEEGTHESLIQQGGKYAELFEIQSRYYRDGGMENNEEEKI
jgi:ABC-type multidrug transport system, ATPase and permease components